MKKHIAFLPFATLAAVLLSLSYSSYGQSFVAPFDGTVYVRCVGGSAGAVSQFGTGTSSENFVPLLHQLPTSCPGDEVQLGDVHSGQTVVFGIRTVWGDKNYWAFSTSSDPASIVAFRDTHNSLGMNSGAVEQTDTNTWVMHLDDAASYMVDDNNADLLIQVRLGAPGEAPLPPSPSEDLPGFVVPSNGTLYLRCVGGSAGAVSQFGVETPGGVFMPLLSPLPESCPGAEIPLGEVHAGQTIVFGINTLWNNVSYWAFSNGTDPASTVAFHDTHNTLGMGRGITEPVKENIWVMHLDDAASYLVDDNNADILIQLRLVPNQ